MEIHVVPVNLEQKLTELSLLERDKLSFCVSFSELPTSHFQKIKKSLLGGGILNMMNRRRKLYYRVISLGDL